MLEIFGKNYYIDIDRVIDKCRYNTKLENLNLKEEDLEDNEEELENDEEDLEDDEEETDDGSLQLNIFKYEIIKMCVDRILNDFEGEEVDEKMGIFGGKDTPTSFKLAFNTLIKTEILKEDDE